MNDNKLSDVIINNISVIILAAGKSERMGFPKPFLKWNEEKTFLEKIIDEYKNFSCNRINIVVSSDFPAIYFKKGYNFLKTEQLVINNNQEYERFYSVKLGLSAATPGNYCFLQDADNPFVNKKILLEIYKKKEQKKYVTPVHKGRGGHPLLFSPEIVDYISKIDADNLDLRDVLRNFERVKVEVEYPEILININTQEDYNKYFQE